MRQTLRDQTVALAALFRSKKLDELPMQEVLHAVRPDLGIDKALDAFRNNVKKQLNKHLEKLVPPVRLAHPGDNRPITAKTIWMEREMTEAEAVYNPEIIRRVEAQDQEHRDTPETEYIAQAAVTAREPPGQGRPKDEFSLQSKTVQIIQDHLPKELIKKVVQQQHDKFLEVVIPPVEGGQHPLTLWIANAGMTRIPKDLTGRGDWWVVQTKNNVLPQYRQVVPDEIPALLQAWLERDRLSPDTLHKAGRGGEYPEEGYIFPEICQLRFDVPAHEREILVPDARQLLRTWLLDSQVAFCVVLGDYGMGKTFLCRMFTRMVIEERQAGNDALPAPLYLDLRDLPPRVPGQSLPTLEDMLTDLCQRAGFGDLPVPALLAMTRAGYLVLIFDGFDELAASLSEKEGDYLLREIRKSVPPGSRGKVLISSRTHYFMDRANEEEKIGGGVRTLLTRDGYAQADFRILYLQPFDATRIRQYLEHDFPGQGEEIFNTFQRLHDLSDLAKRPFLLKLITRNLPALRQRARAGRAITAGDIYGVVVEEWVRRDSGKHEMPPFLVMATMEELAGGMWREEKGSYNHKNLFTWMQGQLATLLPGADKGGGILDTLNRLDIKLRTATFISRDNLGNYSFAHTSFQEYFLAGFLVSGLGRGEVAVLDLPRLRPEVLAFFLDRVAEAGNLNHLARLLAQVLEGPCTPRRSENSLFLTIAWQRRWPESAPKPTQWQLTGARLAESDLVGVEMVRATLDQADLFRANLEKSRIQGSLRGANLGEVHAREVDWQGCDLRQACLDGGDLAGANLQRVNLLDTPLRSVMLQRANLHQVTWSPPLFSLVRLAYAQLPDHFNSDSSTLDACSFLSGLDPSLALRIQSGHSTGVCCVAFSSGRNIIASGSDDSTIRLWDAGTGSLIRTLAGHAQSVRSVAFSPDGVRLASGSTDKTIRIWDGATGNWLRTFTGHEKSVTSVVFNPEGTRLASGSEDNTIRIWDGATGDLLRILMLTKHANSSNWSVAFSPEGTRLASGSEDKTIRIWDGATGSLLRTLTGHENSVLSVAFSPDGTRLASGSEDQTIRIWDGATGSLLCTLTGHENSVLSVAFSLDGTCLASGSEDKNIWIWEGATGACLHKLTGHKSSVLSVAFSPDGTRLASGSLDNTIRIWDGATGSLLRTLTGHENRIWSVAFSPGGTRLASGSSDKTIRIWDGATGSLLRTLTGHENRVLSVAFSPDGTRLASGSDDKTIRIWDGATGSLLRTLTGHENSVRSVAFSPDGTRLASGSNDQTIRIWDGATGSLLRTLTGHENRVWSVAFSPDGTRLASGSSDKTIRIWDGATGSLLRTLTGHESWVWSIAFSPDGTKLLSGGPDGLRLWEVNTGGLLAILWNDGEQWLVVTPEGYFDGNTTGIDRLAVVHNSCAYPATEFRQWQQPGLLGRILGVTAPKPKIPA
ncbi:MAG: pentapeptide repeat-containing protein [Magnetococcus sp. DMHC-1]